MSGGATGILLERGTVVRFRWQNSGNDTRPAVVLTAPEHVDLKVIPCRIALAVLRGGTPTSLHHVPLKTQGTGLSGADWCACADMVGGVQLTAVAGKFGVLDAADLAELDRLVAAFVGP